MVARQALGGGATAVDLYIYGDEQASGTAVASLPRENIAVKITSAAPTASATDAFIDTPILGVAILHNKAVLRVKVTAVGAWTILGYVVMEQ